MRTPVAMQCGGRRIDVFAEMTKPATQHKSCFPTLFIIMTVSTYFVELDFVCLPLAASNGTLQAHAAVGHFATMGIRVVDEVRDVATRVYVVPCFTHSRILGAADGPPVDEVAGAVCLVQEIILKLLLWLSFWLFC